MRSESHEQVDGAMNNFWRKSALMITPMLSCYLDR